MNLPIVESLEAIHTVLDADEARKLKALVVAVSAFASAPTRSEKELIVKKAQLELAPLGLTGLSLKSMYRKADQLERAYRAGGVTAAVLALADKRVMRRIKSGIGTNRELVEYWHQLCGANRRKTAPAYRALLSELASGASIPGVGTWRDVWAKEHGGVYPSDEMECPWSPLTLDAPEGWSLRNFMRLKPDDFVLAAARQGLMSAKENFLPTVPRTRVGLKCCQVLQFDDAWHEVKVAWHGNKHAQRVVELSMIDVLTGYTIGFLCKPIRERPDGTKETLKQEWAGYFLAYLACNIGLPDCGTLIMGEHGTASVDSAFLARLTEATNGKIRFGAGSIMTGPLAAGLPCGPGKGNPRYKALLEGYHAVLKNELGSVKGHIGGGRGKQPEETYGLDKQDERLRRIATALEHRFPGIAERLQLPYIPYEDYMRLVYDAYDRLDRRSWHKMEGWESSGFVVGEVRHAGGAWTPLNGLPPEQARALKALADAGEMEFRLRRMSPKEAWQSRQGELTRMSDVVAPLIMGKELAQTCTCDKRLQLKFNDMSTLRKDIIVAGVLDSGVPLERGARYLVWINPLAGEKAYIATESGRYLGVAPVLVKARIDDTEAMHKAFGVRQSALSVEMKRLEPIVRSRMQEESRVLAHNVKAIGLVDPVAEEQRTTEIEDRLESAGTPIDFSDAAPLEYNNKDTFDEDFI